MPDAQARGIGKAVKLVGMSPAEKVGRDNVKASRESIDVSAPGDLRRSTVFATMEQDQIRTAAGFEEMRLDVARNNRSSLIRGHEKKGPLKKGCAAVDGDGLTGHKITER